MKYLLFLILPILISCQTENAISKYPKFVGDIQFDAKLDHADFKKCGEGQDYSFQYYYSDTFQYKGEKIAIINEFEKQNISGEKSSNGYIIIRFLVNCEGKTGMFRMQKLDSNYKETPSDEKLGEQLLNFTKSLKGWIPKKIETKPVDYYQYLNFKLQDGKIVEILP